MKYGPFNLLNIEQFLSILLECVTLKKTNQTNDKLLLLFLI